MVLVGLHGLVGSGTANQLVGELGLVRLGGELLVGAGLVTVVYRRCQTLDLSEGG